jgi:hypothetical protein
VLVTPVNDMMYSQVLSVNCMWFRSVVVTFFSVFTSVFLVFISSVQRRSSSLQGYGSLAEFKVSRSL